MDGDIDDQTKKALVELAELHRRNPQAFEGLVRWYTFANNLGIVGVGIKNLLIVIGVVIGSWLAFKGWLSMQILGP